MSESLLDHLQRIDTNRPQSLAVQYQAKGRRDVRRADEGGKTMNTWRYKGTGPRT